MSDKNPDTVSPLEPKAVDILREIKSAVIKPPTWNRKTVSPYYRLKFALEVKQVIDGMIADKQDRVYYYAKFSKHPFKFSSNTLYSYVYQSLRFLKQENIEGVDKKYYADIIDKIRTTREAGVGVRLSFHTDIAAAYVDIAPDKIESKVETSKMRAKIDKWIEEAEVGDVFEAKNIGLSAAEINDINDMLSGTESFLLADVQPTNIKIRKIK